MTSEFDMLTIDIPYGVLHDSRLTGVKFENNQMMFSFDIKIYPEDYTNDFYKQYENFKHCNMIVDLSKEPCNDFIFKSCLNNQGEFKGISLNTDDFLNAINTVFKATFIECSVTYGEFNIELSVDFHNAKGKNKKLKKYNLCNITLDATKVKWEWF